MSDAPDSRPIHDALDQLARAVNHLAETLQASGALTEAAGETTPETEPPQSITVGGVEMVPVMVPVSALTAANAASADAPSADEAASPAEGPAAAPIDSTHVPPATRPEQGTWVWTWGQTPTDDGETLSPAASDE